MQYVIIGPYRFNTISCQPTDPSKTPPSVANGQLVDHTMVINANSSDVDLAFEAHLVENNELTHIAENSNNSSNGSEGIFLGDILLEDIF